jgi:hypothetical protein
MPWSRSTYARLGRVRTPVHGCVRVLCVCVCVCVSRRGVRVWPKKQNHIAMGVLVLSRTIQSCFEIRVLVSRHIKKPPQPQQIVICKSLPFLHKLHHVSTLSHSAPTYYAWGRILFHINHFLISRALIFNSILITLSMHVFMQLHLKTHEVGIPIWKYAFKIWNMSSYNKLI